MQATGGVVGGVAELAACVQLGEDHLDAGEPGAGLGVHGDAAGMVDHPDRPVGAEGDLDLVAEAGECLVDGVVDDLPEAVHEAAGVRGSDVHGRPLPDRLQALKNQQILGLVVSGVWLVALRALHRPRLPTSDREHCGGPLRLTTKKHQR